MSRQDIECKYRERDVPASADAYPADARAGDRQRMRKMRALRYMAGLTARGKQPVRPDWSKAI
jgi:hypothetical protein